MNIILASKSGVRKMILEKNNINFKVVPSNVDEDQAKESLESAGADSLLISKNLAELKSIKVSKSYPETLVLGADSVVSLNDKIINKPKDRDEAFNILKKLNNTVHYLISSVCISVNGAMIWNFSDKSELKMKNLNDSQMQNYLSKIQTDTLTNYGVYQIEAKGLELFEYIKGDKNSIMGLPIDQIKEFIKRYKK
tara:strand:- start:101 stop:685 length:585 start_codon:yes stop_codon:yes gene_type:complete